MILEEAGDRSVEMYTICPSDVMLVLGIDHVVGVGTRLDAGLYEELGMLPEHDWVYRAVDQQETTLEVLGT